MKRTLLIFAIARHPALAGCFETTQEMTLNEDGSGVDQQYQ